MSRSFPTHGMSVLGGLIAVSSGIGLAAAFSCGGSGVFVCAEDSQCNTRGTDGRCELNGYCSFPSELCESGRRYGQAAAEVAGDCVEPQDAATTGSTGPTSTSTAGTTTDASTTVSLDGGLVTGTDDGAGSTSGDPTTTATTGPPPVEVCDGMDNDGDGLIDEVSAQNDVCNGCRLEQRETSAYWFCDDARAWAAARQDCQGWGADLIIIVDDAEQNFVEMSFAAAAWLGGTDEGMEGEWRWVDGTSVQNSGWAPGQPDGLQMQNCLAGLPGGWRDRSCLSNYPHGCEASHSL